MTPNWGGTVNALKGRAATLRDPDVLEKQANGNLYEIKHGQMWSPALGKEEPLAVAQAGGCQAGEQLCSTGEPGDPDGLGG